MTFKLPETDIKYGNYAWNFWPGCDHWKDPKICPVGPDDCWSIRGNKHYGRSNEPHLVMEKLLISIKSPGRVLVNFTGDTGGDWVHPAMPITIEGIEFLTLRDCVFEQIKLNPQSKFLFLTKRPDNLCRWGLWPDNAWVGATVCNQAMAYDAYMYFKEIPAKNKWVSIEPLMSRISNDNGKVLDYLISSVSWVVIGSWSRGTGHGQQPDISWIREIVFACDKAGIPVWLKENLTPLLMDNWPNQPWAFSDGYYTSEEQPYIDRHLRRRLLAP